MPALTQLLKTKSKKKKSKKPKNPRTKLHLEWEEYIGTSTTLTLEERGWKTDRGPELPPSERIDFDEEA